MTDLGPVLTAYCCREWPVYVYYQIRRCGLCGEIPVVDWRDRMDAEIGDVE